MTFESIIGLVSGEAGTIAILVLVILFLVSGKVYPKEYVDSLKKSNETLLDTLKKQEESLKIISDVAVESLENSKTTVRVLNEVRRATGVRGEDYE